jgi:hypothetical protein
VEAPQPAASLERCAEALVRWAHLADYVGSKARALSLGERALRGRKPPDFGFQRVELVLRAELDFRRPLWPPFLLADVDEPCRIRPIKSSGNSVARVFA